MFNQLVKWTIIVGLWRKYKSHVMATGLLLLSLILINYIHLDFVEYSVATKADSLGFSYLLKWSALGLAILVYSLYIRRVNAAAKYDSKLHRVMQSTSTASRSEQVPNETEDEGPDNIDPFANIRAKKKLRSEADFLIDKEK